MGEYNDYMVEKTLILKMVFNPKSVLELGCGTGQLVDIFRMNGVEAYGIDISKYATANNKNLICGDVCVVDYPLTDMVCSFDLLEHLTEEQIDIVIDKCGKFPIMFHSISTSFDEYGDVTWIKGMDKSHISMHSPSWWLKKFYDQYGTKYFITLFTRTDYISIDEGKHKFTNTNFILSKQSKKMAHI